MSIFGNGEIDFDSLAPKADKFKYGGRNFVICEASEAATTEWRNFQNSCRKYDAETGRLVSFEGLADSEPLLISMCVLEIGAVGEERRVSKEDILKWGSRVAKPVYNRILEISGLADEEDTVETLDRKIKALQTRKGQLEGSVKNGQSPSTGGTSDTVESTAKNSGK